ncbi:MAG: lipoate--protein ligase [Oscillospiraceae bacterium]|nr:lipoate--protein ligase [Oscillospiraceae bacterium]
MNLKPDTIYFSRSTSHDPYINLAREHVLTENVLPGSPILYLWSNSPTVVIGKNQDCYAECRVEEILRDGVNLVRRFSGGGAVWHDLGNLCFSFCCTRDDYDVQKQTDVILTAMRSLGFNAEKTGRNDMEIGGRKFSGNAYYEAGGNKCHHGTVMISCDMSKLGDYLTVSETKLKKHAVRSVRSRVVNLSDLDPSVNEERVADALRTSFEKIYGGPSEYLPAEAADTDASELAAELRNRNWIINKLLKDAVTYSGTFDWGSVTISLTVSENAVTDCTVTTDLMDSEIPRLMAEYIIGKPFSKKLITDAALSAGGPGFSGDISTIL